jgi:hypothetical protein
MEQLVKQRKPITGNSSYFSEPMPNERKGEEVFYGTQYHPTVVRWYYRFFQFCTMCKMVICSMYII